jgi:hypothetical protein
MDKLAQYELEALNLRDKLTAEGKTQQEIAAAFYTLLLKQSKELDLVIVEVRDESTGC